jgi:hypothetical protein
MYILLTMFFISLLAIMAMIGRKMVMLNAIEGERAQEEMLAIPLLEEIRENAGKHMRKYGYIGLVITMRTYFKSTSFLKRKMSDAKTKVKTLSVNSKIINSVKENKETSKFLQMVSDYKHKLRKIKREIEKEQKGL